MCIRDSLCDIAQVLYIGCAGLEVSFIAAGSQDDGSQLLARRGFCFSPYISYGPDGFFGLFHSPFGLREVAGIAVLRPLSLDKIVFRVVCLLFAVGQEAPDFFRDERHERMEQLEHVLEAHYKSKPDVYKRQTMKYAPVSLAISAKALKSIILEYADAPVSIS